MNRRFIALLAAVILPAMPAIQSCGPVPELAIGSALNEHERLQVRNTFKTPEDVVKYYCGRDASGFVWSGLLEIERKNFTLWKELPQSDSFYVAKTYEVSGAHAHGGDEATVDVQYELMGLGDAHGTISPTDPTKRKVTFRLKRDNGVWKIAEPDAKQIAPVVLAAKFQYAAQQAPN